MSEKEIKKIRNSILHGLDISLQRLIERKKRTNSDLSFSEGKKIIQVKAADL